MTVWLNGLGGGLQNRYTLIGYAGSSPVTVSNTEEAPT